MCTLANVKGQPRYLIFTFFQLSFISTCVYSKLGSTCRCPTCHLPARVGNLLKNPTYDILVACVSKLVDLRRGKKKKGGEADI